MTTVFVVARWPSALLVSIAAIVVVILVCFMLERRQFVAPDDQLLALWMTGALAVAVVGAISFLFFRQAQLRDAYVNRRTAMVEGCLGGFIPSRVPGHSPDVIRIGDRELSYSDNIDTGGYNTTEAMGGQIHADTKVRIHLVGDVIVRLDVQQHACPSAPRT